MVTAMSENEIHEQDKSLEEDEGLEMAKRLAEEEEGISRRPKGPSKLLFPPLR